MSRLSLLKHCDVGLLQKVMRIVVVVSEIPWRCEVYICPHGPQHEYCAMWPMGSVKFIVHYFRPGILRQTLQIQHLATKHLSFPNYFNIYIFVYLFIHWYEWYKKVISSSKYMHYILIWSAEKLHSLVSPALDFKPEEQGLSPGGILLLVVLL